MPRCAAVQRSMRFSLQKNWPLPRDEHRKSGQLRSAPRINLFRTGGDGATSSNIRAPSNKRKKLERPPPRSALLHPRRQTYLINHRTCGRIICKRTCGRTCGPAAASASLAIGGGVVLQELVWATPMTSRHRSSDILGLIWEDVESFPSKGETDGDTLNRSDYNITSIHRGRTKAPTAMDESAILTDQTTETLFSLLLGID
jgi:hypothetical protein